MDWFEECVLVSNVSRASEAEASDELSAEIADDVAEHVARDDDAIVMGVLHEPHAHRVNVGLPEIDPRIILRDLTSGPDHEARGLANHVRLLDDRHGRIVELLRILEGRRDDVAASLAGVDPQADSDVFERCLLDKARPLGVLGELSREALRYGVILNTDVEVLGVLPEDDEIDVVLVVERVAGVALTRPQVRRQVELLAQANDRALIGQVLRLELRSELRLSLFLRL